MMRILLQFPEGLKQKAMEYAKRYEKDGHEAFLSASPCYGACDIALDEARWIKADKIIHFGHNKFLRSDSEIPIEYIEFKVDVDINKLASILPLIKNKKNIALATTVQHIHQFKDMKSFFERNGKKVFADRGERASEIGQVLGCDALAITKVEKNVDAIVFVGNGMFHALAIDPHDDKIVLVFDPYDGSVRDIREDIKKLKKRRMGSLIKALGAKRFGILLSTKPGQFNIALARNAKDELGKHGLDAHILVGNELDPMALNNFLSFDCFISTACPRIADDSEKFEKPVLNPAMLNEFFRMLKETKKSPR